MVAVLCRVSIICSLPQFADGKQILRIPHSDTARPAHTRDIVPASVPLYSRAANDPSRSFTVPKIAY